MGARVTLSVEGETLGEPFGTIHAEPGELRGTVVRAGEIPGLIDEVPLLAALAARADGETRFEQVGELRVKESDRLAQIAGNLTALGYPATGAGNVLTVHGSDHPPRGRVTTEGDHRIAMAFAVLGTVPGARIVLDDRDCVAVSFPGFFAALDRAKGPR
jgi:3-phosphoshikimate 1-carboxyvinyltransferase